MSTAFGDLFRRHLEERGLSIPEFALKVSLHRSYVGYIARGDRKPPISDLERFATALSLSGAQRDEFILEGHLANSPELIVTKFRELQEQVRRRR